MKGENCMVEQSLVIFLPQSQKKLLQTVTLAGGALFRALSSSLKGVGLAIS